MSLQDEVKDLIDLKAKLEEEKTLEKFDPQQMLEDSLFSFLNFRIEKLKRDIEFQDDIVEYIRARLPEAEFSDLRILLQQEQQNTNAASQALLSPFTNRSLEPDKSKVRTKSQEEELFETSTKDNLQSFQEMFHLFNELKNFADEKKETNSASIKKALEESLQEESGNT